MLLSRFATWDESTQPPSFVYQGLFYRIESESKAKKKTRASIQQIVCPMELIPSMALCILIPVFGCLCTSKASSPHGSWFSTYALWNYDWKVWATYTTLFMTFNWQNEADATKKNPVFESKRNPIAACACLTVFLDVYYTWANAFLFGVHRGMPSTTVMCFLALPLLACICSFLFQVEAGKVAKSLSAASAGNAALAAFRKKMITNLAYGGVLDMVGFFGTLIIAPLPSTRNAKNFKAFTTWSIPGL